MSKRKYITYNEELTSQLGVLGFKRKRGYSFVKEMGEAVCELAFSHSTHHEHGVKYYSVNMLIEYPKAQEIINKICKTNLIIGDNIGNVMLEHFYKEWRVSETDSDDEVAVVVNDIYNVIVSYAIPYFRRHSRIENVLEDLEKCNLRNQANVDYYLPLLYYLTGNTKLAVSFLERELNRKERLSKKTFDDYPSELPEPHQSIETQEERSYKAYKEFTVKFMQYIETADQDHRGRFQ